MKGNLLTLVVSYAGGCRDHDFTLYMSPPGFADSGDSRAILYLWHDGKSDQCGTSVGDTLVFDLLPIGELYMGLFGMTDQIALELKTGFEAPTRRIVYTPDLNFTVSSPPRP